MGIYRKMCIFLLPGGTGRGCHGRSFSVMVRTNLRCLPVRRCSRPSLRKAICLASLLLVLCSDVSAAGAAQISGQISDLQGAPVANVHLKRLNSAGAVVREAASDSKGNFTFVNLRPGQYQLIAESASFAPVDADISVAEGKPTEINLRFKQLASVNQSVTVFGTSTSALDPDSSERVVVHDQVLDANPGRPGAPISIPGLPIETASGGIKAPQYFAPGVAGDHGEPIAQYISLGGYLVPNNLSANAHGNGYADPNIFVSAVLGSVRTDGGAYNILEGNHSLNLAATYGLRPRLARFVTLAGDYRDIDLAAGLVPSDPAKKEWLALEANYGNGLLRRLEHRQHYKWNGLRVFDPGNHEVSLFSLGYYGNSHEGNLVPVGSGVQLDDTVDPRQQDQTHTSLMALNDQWSVSPHDALVFSGFFRTYNLALFSNFGEGLIRQSEFRTVQGGEARETHTFKPWLEAMAGVLYNEDDIRNDNLDHYLSDRALSSGPFVKVLSNNVTIREFAPYVGFRGDLGQHLHYYAGLRSEQVELINTDKIKRDYSFNVW